MSTNGGNFVWLLLQSFKVGNLWSTSRKRRPCEAPARREDHVKHQQRKKSFSRLFLALAAILAIFINRHTSNISVKLLGNLATRLGGDVV